MSDERIMILRMLKEGKITEEEAAKLLDVLDNTSNLNESMDKKSPSNENNNWEEDFETKIDKLGTKLEKKFDKFGENFGEKIGKMSENFSEGAGSLTDKVMDIVDSFMEKGDFANILGNYETKNETLELEINDLENPILDIKSINGNISLNPWSKDHIFVKAVCHLKKNKVSTDQKIMDLRKSGNRIILEPLFDSNIGVKLDISVPLKDYNEIKILTTNGKINIYDLSTKNLSSNTTNGTITLNDITTKNSINLTTKNGRIILKDVNSSKINAITKNAAINLEDIVANEGILVSKNGKIVGKDLEVTTIDANTTNAPIRIEDSNIFYLIGKTSNGKIDLNDLTVDSLKEVRLTTSNSGIYINLDNIIRDYKVEATTTNSNIDLNLPQLVYDLNDKNINIKAHKEGFNNDDAILFYLNTTNGNIKVN